MPTLNEEKHYNLIKSHIKYLREILQAELIIVDGSSNDNTRDVLRN